MIEGYVLKYEQKNVNTDDLWPGSIIHGNFSSEEIRKVAMKGFDPNFFDKLEGRSILAVGENFGCGSSREQPSSFLRGLCIKAIISPFFARIFYRNSINFGLPVIESPEAFSSVNDGDYISIDLKNGMLYVRDDKIKIPKYPRYIMQILDSGGVIEHIRNSRTK